MAARPMHNVRRIFVWMVCVAMVRVGLIARAVCNPIPGLVMASVALFLRATTLETIVQPKASTPVGRMDIVTGPVAVSRIPMPRFVAQPFV